MVVIAVAGCATPVSTTVDHPAASREGTSSVDPGFTAQTTPAATSSSSSASASRAPVTAEATIQAFKFSPNPINIHVGDTVRWTNQDGVAHTVTSDAGSDLDSGNLVQGQSYSHAFASAGDVTYHCDLHSTMTARVHVDA